LWKYPEKKECREELLKDRWPHVNKEMALTVKNATEQRNLCNLAYKYKCKWENALKKAELRLGENKN
jgi:hypothetical protein